MPLAPRSVRSLAALLASVALTAGAQTAAPAPAPRFTIDDALDLTTYRVADLSNDGAWLVAFSSVRRDGLRVDYRRDGDPTYLRPQPSRAWVIDTRTGQAKALFPDVRDFGGARWSPDASRIALLVRVNEVWQPMLWERATGRFTTIAVPTGRYVAEGSDIRWTGDGARVVFALHTTEWRDSARAQFARQTSGPVFVQSSKDPFLAWEALQRRGNVRSVAAYEVASRTTREILAPGMIASYQISDDGGSITWSEDISKKTDYDVIFGTENKLLARRLTGDTAAGPRTLFASLKGVNLVWAQDGRHYAFAKDGRVRVASVDDTTSRLVAGPAPSDTGKLPTDSAAADSVRKAREAQRFSAVRLNRAGDALIASNKEGFWFVDVASGKRELFLATPASMLRPPTRNVLAWTNDGRWVYLSQASRDKWERGIVRYDRERRTLDTLLLDARTYGNFQLARDGKTVVLSIADPARPADIYAADPDLKQLRRLVHPNPKLDVEELGTASLMDYLDADGHRKYGVVYYPAGYQKGTRYPTVFNIYEDFFDGSFDPVINVLNANGYVVVQPSVDFDIGYPGEAWVKGVTSAANKLIESGIADSARLGVHGTSYGGYATNLLITQTNRFKAAINISGKVDIISFYTDSPRLGVRNVHAAEKSQDRLGATLWQQPQKYVQHSAIMFADRIQTPLLLMTGGQDSNVPADNTREMFYALRRLGKEVVWANYMNGGHGAGNATPDDYIDYVKRIVAWYDDHLKRDTKKPSATATQQ